MKSLRKIVVLMALAAVSLSGKLAYSQQEVAPDHFDGSDAPVHKAAPVHQRKHGHAMVAKKRSAKQHRSHVSS